MLDQLRATLTGDSRLTNVHIDAVQQNATADIAHTHLLLTIGDTTITPDGTYAVTVTRTDNRRTVVRMPIRAGDHIPTAIDQAIREALR